MIDNNITRTVLTAFDKFLKVRGGCAHPCETQLHCWVTAVMSCYRCYHEVGTKPEAARPPPRPFFRSLPYPSSVGPSTEGYTVVYKYGQPITVRFHCSFAVRPLSGFNSGRKRRFGSVRVRRAVLSSCTTTTTVWHAK